MDIWTLLTKMLYTWRILWAYWKTVKAILMVVCSFYVFSLLIDLPSYVTWPLDFFILVIRLDGKSVCKITYFVSSWTFNINSINQHGQWNVKRCLLNSLCKRALSNMFHGVCMYALRGTFAKLYACRSHLRSFYSLVDWEPTPCVRMHRTSANMLMSPGAHQTVTVTNVVMMEQSTASIH